ncbi:MAG: DUF4129 domain-containing protein [Nocardioides sp.]
MWRRQGPVAAIVVAALTGMLMVTWAATIGPSAVLRGDGPRFLDEPSPTVASTTADPVDEGQPGERPEQSDGSAVGDLVVTVMTVVFAIGILGLVGVLLFSARHGVRRVRDAVRERRGAPDPEETPFDVIDTPTRLARALNEDAERQRDLLAQGTPRNGIVHCWHRLEQLAGEAGLGRKVWETPGEFALRLLTTVEADEDAAYRLTLLYREARFSHHELDESARDEALEALATIHLGLADRAGSLP